MRRKWLCLADLNKRLAEKDAAVMWSVPSCQKTCSDPSTRLDSQFLHTDAQALSVCAISTPQVEPGLCVTSFATLQSDTYVDRPDCSGHIGLKRRLTGCEPSLRRLRACVELHNDDRPQLTMWWSARRRRPRCVFLAIQPPLVL